MAADDYIWQVSYTSNVKETARNNSVSFGEGYEQNAADGINSLIVSIDVTHEEVTDSILAAILVLLRARRGVSYFLWTPPLAGYNTQMKWRCDSWNVQPLQYNSSTLTATLRQVFDA